MESLWSAQTELPERPALEGTIQADVCVVGGGMAGILIGHELKRRGVSAAIIEKDRVGGGVTKGTTAKITAQHGLIYRRLIENVGKEQARQYAESNLRAVERFQEIVERNEIDCDFVRRPSYVYSTEETGDLTEEVKAACSLGVPAEFTTETELPFPVKGAVRFPNQAAFEPLKFLRGVSEKLTVYEHTGAVEFHAGGVETERGFVRAKKLVIATHYPFIDTPGWYFLRMHQERSYAVALTGAPPMEGMYLAAGREVWSFRPQKEYLIVGGAGHRTGQNEVGGSYAKLKQFARDCYPEAKPGYEWSAQDCITMDGVPYIGRYSSSKPDWYVATGFGKWGMTGSMTAAMVLSSLIEGKECSFAEVYSPQRFNVTASASNLWKDGLKAAAGLWKGSFGPPRAAFESLPKGHGGIVEYEGQKVGAYRSEEGELYLVSPKCTHLGCQLEWNPDERTWDCPCHGSRFGYDGHVIEPPAQTPLDRY